ncbi:hypothetical protein [Deinococcus sp. QL22]|uniref:hypothetical protein n=1 Tax=Deinococcus sp. QL22 TaxID=2939437 RepID=UPI002016F0C2|nr:hypothetical protein [Deinococcus sp. QL22]UQN08592.1 hypothetical protein M1R55_20900 [Deinococcus sp. QL22]
MKRFLLPLLLTAASAWASSSPLFSPVLVQLPGDRRAELLGAWTGSAWLSPVKTAPRIRGGETYRPLSLSGLATRVQGGRAESRGAPGDPCDTAFAVPFPSSPAPETFRLLVPGALQGRPRPVVSLPINNPTYRDIVRNELASRGLLNAKVNLLGITRMDLDGNGTQEVIVEAAHFTDRHDLFPPPVGVPGDYSLLLLRQVVNGRVVTTPVGVHLAPQPRWDPSSDTPMPLATLYRLAGVADLNGDGRMEIITFGSYYEGYALNVSEWSPRSGLQSRLQGGCGV